MEIEARSTKDKYTGIKVAEDLNKKKKTTKTATKQGESSRNTAQKLLKLDSNLRKRKWMAEEIIGIIEKIRELTNINLTVYFINRDIKKKLERQKRNG